MPESLVGLEKNRSELVRQSPSWAIFVQGRLSASWDAVATQLPPDRQGEGKTVAETLSSPAALRKAQREVEEFRRFQRLSAELIAANEKICRRRRVKEEAGAWTAEEKNGCGNPSRGGAGNQLPSRIFAQCGPSTWWRSPPRQFWLYPTF